MNQKFDKDMKAVIAKAKSKKDQIKSKYKTKLSSINE